MTFNKDKGKWEADSNRDRKFEWKNIGISIGTIGDSSGAKLAGGLKFSPIDLTNPLKNKAWSDSLANFFFTIINERNNETIVLLNNYKTFQQKIASKLFSLGLISNLSQLQEPFDISKSAYVNKIKTRFDSSRVLYDRKIIANFVLDSARSIFISIGKEDVFNSHLDFFKQASIEFADLFFLRFSKVNFSNLFGAHVLKMKEQFKKDNWNNYALQLSAGGAWQSPSKTLQNLGAESINSALTFGFPLRFKKSKFLSKHSQILLQGKYIGFAKPDSNQLNYSFSAGARFLLGNYTNRFSAEILYVKEENKTVNYLAEGIRYSIGLEVKVSDNNWLELAVGGQNFSDRSGLNILPRFAFRRAFGNENRFFKK